MFSHGVPPPGTVYLLVIASTQSGLAQTFWPPFHCFSLSIAVIKYTNVVKEVDHTHEQELSKYVIHV